MKNEKIPFHVKFVKCISDFGFYQKLREETTGRAMTYLLLLTITLGVLWLVRPVASINTGVTQMISAFSEGVPEFTFKNGELHVDGNMPMKLGDEQNVVIIDTTGKTDESALDNYNSGVFIGKNYMVQKKSSAEKQYIDLTQAGAFELDKTDVENLLPLFRGIAVIFAIFGLPWFFVSKLIAALLLGIIGLIMCSVKSVVVKFGDLYKWGIYALTLPILIKVALGLADVHVPHFWLVYYAIGAVYMWNAIVPTPMPAPKQEIPDDGPVQQ